MEGLILLLAELLFSAALAAAAMLWSAVGGVAALFVSLAGSRTLSKIAAWIGGAAALIAILIIAAVYILNAYYFEPTVRFIAGRVSERTGAEIRYETVEGSLTDGRLTFTGLRAVRKGHSERDFSFAADRASVHLDLWSVLPFASPTFESVHIETVRGTLVERGDPAETGDSRPSRGGRPDFAINDLRIADLAVTVEKPGGRRLVFDMPRIEARPLRSEVALFDVMFRSNVEGTVDGHPVRIATEAKPEGRLTRWDIRRIPLSTVSAFVDRAPLTWFQSGTASIDVRDEWRLGETADIDMDWRFVLENARIEAPAAAGIEERALAFAAGKYVEARDGRLDLSFQLVLNRKEFRTAASGDAAALFRAIADAFAAALAEETGERKEDVKQDLEDAADAARDYLNRRRKEK